VSIVFLVALNERRGEQRGRDRILEEKLERDEGRPKADKLG
jgi:hypothetical protein